MSWRTDTGTLVVQGKFKKEPAQIRAVFHPDCCDLCGYMAGRFAMQPTLVCQTEVFLPRWGTGWGRGYQIPLECFENDRNALPKRTEDGFEYASWWLLWLRVHGHLKRPRPGWLMPHDVVEAKRGFSRWEHNRSL